MASNDRSADDLDVQELSECLRLSHLIIFYPIISRISADKDGGKPKASPVVPLCWSDQVSQASSKVIEPTLDSEKPKKRVSVDVIAR